MLLGGFAVKKRFFKYAVIILSVFFIFIFSACSEESMLYTSEYEEQSMGKIKIILDTSDGYSIRESKLGYVIRDKEGFDVLIASLAEPSYYTMVVDIAKDPVSGEKINCKINTNKKGEKYAYLTGDLEGIADVMIVQQVDGTDYVVKLVNARTGSTEGFDDAFRRLSFYYKK